MQNYVTFETAKKLKEAGFPQPEPERGQSWYYADSAMVDTYEVLVLHIHITGDVQFDSKYGSDTLSREDFGGLFFAPKATDIIRDLGEDYTIQLNGPNWLVMSDFAGHEHENPAEAAALAWLSLSHPQ